VSSAIRAAFGVGRDLSRGVAPDARCLARQSGAGLTSRQTLKHAIRNRLERCCRNPVRSIAGFVNTSRMMRDGAFLSLSDVQ
jgi:hypothetical protein